MLTMHPGRIFQPSGSIPNTVSLAPQAAIPYIVVNSLWYAEKLPNIMEEVYDGALADAAAATIYTVTAGKYAVIYVANLFLNTVGIIRFRHNGVNLFSLAGSGGQNTTYQPSKPMVMPTTGGTIDVLNNSGGAVAAGGNVILAEYP